MRWLVTKIQRSKKNAVAAAAAAAAQLIFKRCCIRRTRSCWAGFSQWIPHDVIYGDTFLFIFPHLMCAMISSSDDQSFFFFENVSDAYTRICLDCCPRAHQLKMANSKWALIQSDNETQGLTRPASRPHLDRIGEPMLVVALQEGKSIMKDFRFPKKKTRHPKRPFKVGTFLIDCFFSYSNYFSFFSTCE